MNIELEVQDVVRELCSTDQGKLLWENAQLRVMVQKQNAELVKLRNDNGVPRSEPDNAEARSENQGSGIPTQA